MISVRRAVFLGAALAVGWPAFAQGTVAAEVGSEPLAFTVHPSGVEGQTARIEGPAVQAPSAETLDARLARRASGLRFICIGCSRSADPQASAPFYPIRTLNAPQLDAAVAGEP